MAKFLLDVTKLGRMPCIACTRALGHNGLALVNDMTAGGSAWPETVDNIALGFVFVTKV